MPTTATSLPCLACGSRRSLLLGRWEEMPLSVLGLPRTRSDALAMGRHVLDVRRCTACGHVWNGRFDYDSVPYRDGSNLMFNRGHFWRQHQREVARRWIERFELRGRCVVEIGAGEGRFLAHFQRAGNRCIAWEPGPDAERCALLGLETRRATFAGEEAAETRPDAIICRHVLEHLPDPRAFLSDIRRGCLSSGAGALFLAEVPRIERALEQHRLNDFLYEHVSHFTDHSLRVLFERAGWRVLEVRRGYGDEVLTLAARPRRRRDRSRPVGSAPDPAGLREASRRFRRSVDRQIRRVRAVLDRWAQQGRRVAIWGATGKGTALMNIFGIGAERVPLVVDSDPRKVGAYVPGTGQRIESPREILERRVDAIVISSPWRARDIEYEAREQHGIEAELWVYHRGRLIPLTPELEL